MFICLYMLIEICLFISSLERNMIDIKYCRLILKQLEIANGTRGNLLHNNNSAI